MPQLIKPQIKWTPDKITLLKEHYPLGDKKLLASQLGIKYTTLVDAARRFGVRSIGTLHKNKCSVLLNDTPVSNYWQGFIMGDGNVGVSGQLRITLSDKDYSHLEKLNEYMPGKLSKYSTTTTYSPGNYCAYCVNDINMATEFLKRYHITGPKTYNPPDISYLDTPDKFLAFFVGFFDADGCFDFRKNGIPSSLKIEIHKNWEQVLKNIQSKLLEYYKIESTIKITSRGYIKLMIYKYCYLKKLKMEATKLELPFLLRKWDNVDVSYTAKKNKFAENISTIHEMVLSGIGWDEISKFIGLNKRTCETRYNSLDQSLKPNYSGVL